MGRGGSGLRTGGGGNAGGALGTSTLVSAPLGTRVIGGNGKIYVKGQDELPWREEGTDNRYASNALPNLREIGGVKLFDTAQMNKTIDKTGFASTGGGQWTLELEGIGGASILDETGGSRALRLGLMPSQKLYSVQWWDRNYNISDTQYFESLNAAKSYAKNNIKSSLT